MPRIDEPVREGVIAIPLKGKSGAGLCAWVDECDAHLAAGNWRAARRGKTVYATMVVNTYLHHAVASPGPGLGVDMMVGSEAGVTARYS